MMGFIAWMIGSKVGRYVATGLFITSFLGLFALRIFAKDKAAERARQTQEALKRLRERMKSDADISRLPADERRRRLSDDWFQ